MKVVISPKDSELNVDEMTNAYTEEGVMVNSGEFNGMKNVDAKKL